MLESNDLDVSKSFLDELCHYLADEGERIVKAAYASHTFQNRLYNLHDSYGSSVFVAGVEQPGCRRYATPEMSKGLKNYNITRNMNGRQAIDNYFDKYAKRTRNDHVELVIVAAMFYASFLENPDEAPHIQHKYKVIALAKDELDKLKRELDIRGVRTRTVRVRDEEYQQALREGYGQE